MGQSEGEHRQAQTQLGACTRLRLCLDGAPRDLGHLRLGEGCRDLGVLCPEHLRLAPVPLGHAILVERLERVVRLAQLVQLFARGLLALEGELLFVQLVRKPSLEPPHFGPSAVRKHLQLGARLRQLLELLPCDLVREAGAVKLLLQPNHLTQQGWSSSARATPPYM